MSSVCFVFLVPQSSACPFTCAQFVQYKLYTSNLQVDWCLDKTLRSRINVLVNKYLDLSQKKTSV